jgi:hypothetical protein
LEDPSDVITVGYQLQKGTTMNLCGVSLGLSVMISGCDKKPPGEKPTTDNQSTEAPTTRMSFNQLFEVNGNNVTPKQIIRYGTTTMTPAVPFESNVMTIDNAPFSQYIGRDADVKKSGDVYEIVKFY